jgi:hypothetical protein
MTKKDKSLSMTHYSLNAKRTEQRNNMGSCKRKVPITYKGKHIRIATHFSAETLK